MWLLRVFWKNKLTLSPKSTGTFYRSKLKHRLKTVVLHQSLKTKYWIKPCLGNWIVQKTLPSTVAKDDILAHFTLVINVSEEPFLAIFQEFELKCKMSIDFCSNRLLNHMHFHLRSGTTRPQNAPCAYQILMVPRCWTFCRFQKRKKCLVSPLTTSSSARPTFAVCLPALLVNYSVSFLV